MAAPRPLLLALLLVATPLLAGCNAKDWYDHRGQVYLEVMPVKGENSSIDSFQTLRVALYGASVKQVGSIDTHEYTWGDSPLVVDLAELARKGEGVPITSFRMSLRAIESVTLRLDVLEAVDARGKNLQVCRIGDTVREWPCFFMPDNGAFRYSDKAIPIPRGGTIEVHFPLEVKYTTRDTRSQYYLDTDPSKIVLEKR